MAKFFKISVFFLLFSCILTAGSAQNVPGNEPEADIFCNAPAPDSFRITAIGNDWVSLAWTPAWQGATHRIIIALQVDSTVFTPIDTLPSVPEDSITLTDFAPGKYRIAIATNCKEGGTGDEDSFLNPTFGLIIDLVIGGRTPTDPIEMPECTELTYTSYNWIGFEIIRYGEPGMYNFFEFKEGMYNGEPAGLIKRNFEFASLVVANDFGIYPRQPQPLDVPTGQTIYLKNLQFNSTAGAIEIKADLFYKKLYICKSSAIPWNGKYILKVLVAQSSSNFTSPENRSNLLAFNNSGTEEVFKVNTLFSEEIVITPSTETPLGDEVITTIFDMSGKARYSQTTRYDSSPFSIPTLDIIPGCYILKIKSKNNSNCYKIIKGK